MTILLKIVYILIGMATLFLMFSIIVSSSICLPIAAGIVGGFSVWVCLKLSEKEII